LTVSASLLYAHRTLYHWSMRALYGRHFQARYQALAALVPPGVTVVDVCAGDCYLYLAQLRDKAVHYLGLDISPQMVAWARRRGVAVREFNVWQEAIPAADFVLMQGSLYQFMAQAQHILHRLIAAARCKVLIAEPIQNLTASPHRRLATLSHWLTVPAGTDGTYTGRRFDRATLLALFATFREFEGAYTIPGGRECIGIFTGHGTVCKRRSTT
jgi:SAM-dependent methyltransferase